MALTTAYLTTVKNVPAFLDSLISAKAPDNFSQKFIEGLGFKSTNDRLFTAVLRGIGFLDGNNAPTETYFKFLDQSESKKVLAEAIETAYGDLFALKKDANALDVAEIKNKLRTLTQGKYSDEVINRMANTFKGLCEYAEWSDRKTVSEKPVKKETPEPKKPDVVIESPKPEVEQSMDRNKIGLKNPDFHYNIQIHLPDSRDEAVYDAIFKSLRKHIF